MNWEVKTQMCQFLNQSLYADALNLVMANIDTMDEQAWDMFYHGLESVEDSIAPQLEQHKVIRERNKDMKFGSFRTAIRVAAYEMVVDGLLEKQSKN